ncbi:hypothetical protein WME75_29460 [Sorangium sp. So ce1014]|uniref:hypothetical protein n=1 Tax=Sorangium sp. So ce1014 TaxID=3133326 RepID=UPI003F611FD5
MGTGLTLERVAELRAQMEAGRLRDEVLARAGLTAEDWTAAQRDWLERMGEELDHGCFELTNRYTQAFLEHQRDIVAASPPAGTRPGPMPITPPRAAPAPRCSEPTGLTGTAPLPDMSACIAALPFVPRAPPRPVPAAPVPPPAPPGGTAPLHDMPALVASLPFIPAPAKRPAPATPPTEPIAARTAPALALEHYAALCAELSLDPRGAAAIYPRYGLRDAAAWQAADAEWQVRMRGDSALEARWQQLIAYYRAYYTTTR